MGQVLRPIQLRGRDRETSPQPTTGTDNVVRPVGQRPGARSAYAAGQRQTDATAGGRGDVPVRGRGATPSSFDQVEAEASVSHVVQSRLVHRHGLQPVLAGVAANGRRPVRQ